MELNVDEQTLVNQLQNVRLTHDEREKRLSMLTQELYQKSRFSASLKDSIDKVKIDLASVDDDNKSLQTELYRLQQTLSSKRHKTVTMDSMIAQINSLLSDNPNNEQIPTYLAEDSDNDDDDDNNDDDNNPIEEESLYDFNVVKRNDQIVQPIQNNISLKTERTVERPRTARDLTLLKSKLKNRPKSSRGLRPSTSKDISVNNMSNSSLQKLVERIKTPIKQRKNIRYDNNDDDDDDNDRRVFSFDEVDTKMNLTPKLINRQGWFNHTQHMKFDNNDNNDNNNNDNNDNNDNDNNDNDNNNNNNNNDNNDNKNDSSTDDYHINSIEQMNNNDNNTKTLLSSSSSSYVNLQQDEELKQIVKQQLKNDLIKHSKIKKKIQFSPKKSLFSPRKLKKKKVSKSTTVNKKKLIEGFYVVSYNPRTIIKHINEEHKTNKNKHSLSFKVKPHIINEYGIKEPTIHDENICLFSFPDDIKVQLVEVNESMTDMHQIIHHQDKYKRNNNSFVFMFKHQSTILSKSIQSFEFGGETLYGVCCSYLDLNIITDKNHKIHHIIAPVCFCFLTKYPFFQLHFDVLHGLIQVQTMERIKKKNDKLNVLQIKDSMELLTKYMHSGIPHRGQKITIQMSNILSKDIIFKRNSGYGKDIDTLLARHACSLAWSKLTANNLVDLLEAVIKEYNIIVASDNVALSSACILSFIPLLNPLTWTGVLLPVLPTCLIDYLESPVPMLAGVQYLPKSHLSTENMPERTVVWFPVCDDNANKLNQTNISSKRSIFEKLFKRNNENQNNNNGSVNSFIINHEGDVKIGELPYRGLLEDILTPLLLKLQQQQQQQHNIYETTVELEVIIHEILEIIHEHISPFITCALYPARSIEKCYFDGVITFERKNQILDFIEYLRTTQMLDFFKHRNNNDNIRW